MPINETFKTYFLGFCVIYTLINLIENFHSSEVILDKYMGYEYGLMFQTKSFWGLESKEYGLSWRRDEWYIYHEDYTNGEYRQLFMWK